MPPTKKCPECRQVIPARAKRCDCGYDFTADSDKGDPAPRRPKRSPGTNRAVYALVIVGFSVMILNSLYNTFHPSPHGSFLGSGAGLGFDVFLLVGFAGVVWGIVGLIRGR